MFFDDSIPEHNYWEWLREVIACIRNITTEGGAIYFMHREKNADKVLTVLKQTGWYFQNLIIWKKKTSAVPCEFRYSKQYQIIVFATNGPKPRVFNRLRIDPPTPPEYKQNRSNGVYVTDIWDDIRELTSGYFAGNEALRTKTGERVHKQQSPVALLLRIILTSTLPGDMILDPFAGTGTTLVVAKQLKRHAIGIEIDPNYVELIQERIRRTRAADNIGKHYSYYGYTEGLHRIWPVPPGVTARVKQRGLF